MMAAYQMEELQLLKLEIPSATTIKVVDLKLLREAYSQIKELHTERKKKILDEACRNEEEVLLKEYSS